MHWAPKKWQRNSNSTHYEIKHGVTVLTLNLCSLIPLSEQCWVGPGNEATMFALCPVCSSARLGVKVTEQLLFARSYNCNPFQPRNETAVVCIHHVTVSNYLLSNYLPSLFEWRSTPIMSSCRLSVSSKLVRVRNFVLLLNYLHNCVSSFFRYPGHMCYQWWWAVRGTIMAEARAHTEANKDCSQEAAGGDKRLCDEVQLHLILALFSQ